MPYSLDDQGLRFFFNRFGNSIQKVADSPTVLQMSDLDKSPLMASVTNELPLRDAIMAVGLAAMSNVTSDQSLLLVAREKYLAAINIVRSAVGSTDLSNPVLIFKIITILSLFEVCMARPDLSLVLPLTSIPSDGVLPIKSTRFLGRTFGWHGGSTQAR